MHLLDHLRLDERLVALDVDDDLAGESRGHFRDAIGAGAMRPRASSARCRRSFDRRRDPLVVGGDDDRIDAARRGGAAIDVLDHRTAGDVSERLARKTGRVVSGGDDGDDLWRGGVFCRKDSETRQGARRIIARPARPCWLAGMYDPKC